MLAMLQLAWISIFIAISGINAKIAQNDCDVEQLSIVSIRKNGRHVCSGAIIDEYHVVTSDRCVPSFPHVWNVMNDIAVVSGTCTLKPSGIRILTKEMFSQNHYLNPTENPFVSGLGVLRLFRPLHFGEKVQPIPLSETEVPLDAKLQMVGWMMADREGKKTANLKSVTLKTIDSKKCQSFHKKTLTDSEFCTQPESESDFCKGDRGSPLIYEGKLVGVSTYGVSCDANPIPDVHPIISKNLEYLYNITRT
ncbi:chymotrypsin-2 [Linepithema humile]|uniref:chymotrypsin-2 n=1 Tax=Linepithema humile TaxID=83485 RepID=UPI00062366C8|nr:PREDICTED: chymotrypsin-2-like [Linepithema humile]